jgi:hypothetical protein
LHNETLACHSDGVHVASAAAHESVNEPWHHTLRVNKVRHLALSRAEPKKILVAGQRGVSIVVVSWAVTPLSNLTRLPTINMEQIRRFRRREVKV